MILIDNDSGAKDKLFPTIKENYNIGINFTSPNLFYHVTDNLYLVKAPQKGKTGVSCIEDLFGPSVVAETISGKRFNPKQKGRSDDEYGKIVFAEKVVRPNAGTINFSGFIPLLERIVAVMDHYVVQSMP